MATRKSKKQTGTALIFIGATKRVTVGFPVKGQRVPAFFTFWPNRINRVPADVWGVMLAKKSSPNENTGEEIAGPVEQYLQTGILWEMTAEQAQAIHDGQRPLTSPMGPMAGLSTYSPPEPKRENHPPTPAQQELETGLKAADPELNRIDMGEIPEAQVKPPPAPVVA